MRQGRLSNVISMPIALRFNLPFKYLKIVADGGLEILGCG